MVPDPKLSPDPVEILQQLIRFDTTNPPGNEDPCIRYLEGLLKAAGCETSLFAKDPQRPNLVSRIRGRGEAPPLLLYGHVDVVTTAEQTWTRDPFGGEIADGFVWGRGALDMKGGVAMLVSAFMQIQKEGYIPRGDVILTILADEEVKSDCGAEYIVEEHPEQFEGVKYAIGEFGGFNIELMGRRFYPIQVAEKQGVIVRATVRGAGGHGSSFARDTAMGRAGRMIDRIEKSWLPAHRDPTVAAMIGAIAEHLSKPLGIGLRQLLNPALTNTFLKGLGPLQSFLVPQFQNVVNPTIVRGGDKLNVIPEEVSVMMDARLLPGISPEKLLEELRAVIRDDQVELEIEQYIPGRAEIDMGMFELLGKIIQEKDPEGIPIPMMLPGVSDARFFNRLGIQTYGFIPMQIPSEMEFLGLIHAADERIPVAALAFGTDAIYRAVQRYAG